MPTISDNDRITGPLQPPAGSTQLSTDFPVFDDDDVVVLRRVGGSDWTRLSLGEDYTVSNLEQDTGAVITLQQPAQAGEEYLLIGSMLAQPGFEQVYQERISSAEINRELGRIWAAIQELKRASGQRDAPGAQPLMLPAGERETLPSADQRAGLLLEFDAGGKPITRFSIDSLGNVNTITLRGEWNLAQDYKPLDLVYHNGSSYIASSAHTSAANTEPGVGADWQTVWQEFMQRGIDGLVVHDTFSVGNRYLDLKNITDNVSFSNDVNGKVLHNYVVQKNTQANVVSFSGSQNASFVNFNIDADYSNNGFSGHGFVGVDCNNINVSGDVVDLGNNGGTAGSGIIFYATQGNKNNNIRSYNCTVQAVNAADSTDTNGIIYADTNHSFQTGNHASGIRSFAHELKNNSKYNIIYGVTAKSSGYAVGFGQTTGVGPSNNIVSGFAAEACDVGFISSFGSYNVVANGTLNCDSSPNVTGGNRYGVRLSTGASRNIVDNVCISGSQVNYPARIAGDKNYIGLALFHTSGGKVVFDSGVSGNAVEVKNLDGYTIANMFTDVSGQSLKGANANVRYSIATGEFFGARSGRFHFSLSNNNRGGLSNTTLRVEDDSACSVEIVSDTTAQVVFSSGTAGASLGSLFYRFDQHRLGITVAGNNVLNFYQNSMLPSADAAFSIGSPSARMNYIYSANGVVTTSDENKKKDIRNINEAELYAAEKIRKSIRVWKWKDGDDKLHIGPTVQLVAKALRDAGLDPCDYAFVDETDGTLNTGELAMFLLAAGVS